MAVVATSGPTASVVAAAAALAADRPGCEAAVVGAVAVHLAAALSVRPVGSLAALCAQADRLDGAGRAALEPAPAERTPWLLGAVHEATLDPHNRRVAGAFYTPAPLARALVSWALDEVAGGSTAGGDRPPAVVCDPAVGGGAFLLAAAELAAEGGLDRAAVAGGLLYGCDVDPLAAAVARAAVLLWSGGAGADGLDERIVVADALAGEPPPWSPRGAGQFDAVVGNPPFLNQLATATARGPAAAHRATALVGRAAGYADTSALFLARSLDLVRPGGVVALVQPQSLLAGRHTESVRAMVHARGGLRRLWLEREPVFAAATRVCAPVVVVDPCQGAGAPGRTVVLRGLDPPERSAAPAPAAHTWAPLLARALGVPEALPAGSPAGGTLGEWCVATADFRDQYYGLVPFVREAGDGDPRPGASAPLVTSGLIDPAASLWGRRPTRFAKRQWVAPVVDVAAASADPGLRRWVAARLVPKVVVATQTPVVEAAVDGDGAWLPCTPVITVVPAGPRAGADPEALWRVAAVLLSPVATAWAVEQAGGTALAAGAVKLSARQIGEIPVPPEEGHAHWTAAAEELRSAAAIADGGDRRRRLVAAAGRMLTAYGLDAEHASSVLAWWQGRLIR